MVKACMQLNLSWEVRIGHIESGINYCCSYIDSESDKYRRKGVHKVARR
jgi:hypothetical protein